MKKDSCLSANSLLVLMASIIILRSVLPVHNLPSFPMARTILYVSSVFLFFNKNVFCQLWNNGIELLCLLFLFVLYFFESTRDVGYLGQIEALIVLFVFSLILGKCTPKELELTKYAFGLFIIANCFIAYYERSTMTNLFIPEEESFGNQLRDSVEEFRASGLTGHPVLSGMLTSVVLTFIQLDKSLTVKIRLTSTIIIILGLLCFNSRFNVLISFFSSLYIFREYVYQNKENRIKYIIVFTSLVIIFLYLMFYTTWGGRLFATGDNLVDDSSFARLAAFDVFTVIHSSELWYGDLYLANKMMDVLGLAGIENGFICIILKYGLVFGVPMIIIFLLFQWKSLSCYAPSDKRILFWVFIVIGFTNPHIAHNIPWTFWIFAYYLFRNTKNSKYENL